MRRPAVLLLPTLLLTSAATGCGSTDPSAGRDPATAYGLADPTSDHPSTHAADPLVVRTARQTSGMDALVRGAVSLEDGCVRVRGAAAVWPQGTTWAADDTALVLPDGTEVPLGDEVESGGGFVDAASLTGIDDPDLARDCAGRGGRVVIVNDDVRRVE